MSKETLELMLCLDRKEMETQTALQCAPLLTGVKISNLLTVDQSCHIQTARLFSRTSVSCFLLCESNGKAVYLLYRKEQLKEYLATGPVRELMERFGYEGMELGESYRWWERATGNIWKAARRFLMRLDFFWDIRRRT